MPVARVMRVPVTGSVARCRTARKGFHDNPRTRCGLPSKRSTRRSNCSILGGRSTRTRCSKTRGRPPASPTTLDCGRVLRSLPSAVPIGCVATRKAPTGCFDARRQHWPRTPARDRTTSTSPSFKRGLSNRKIEACPDCEDHRNDPPSDFDGFSRPKQARGHQRRRRSAMPPRLARSPGQHRPREPLA
jgi:hypothetical protein